MAILDVFPALFDNYFIKIIFLIHAALTNIAIIGSYNLGSTYSSYNNILLVTILLSILVDKNVDIILLATAFNIVCMMLDVLLLIAGSQIGLVTTLIIVTNLVFRPISSILLLKNYSARAGVEDPTSGLLEVNVQAPSVPRSRSAYQNIDEPNQTLP